MTIYNKLQNALSEVDGNVEAYMQDHLKHTECANCDCDMAYGHRCIVCDFEITEAGCSKREGHCVDCFDQLQWDLKN